MTLHRRHLLTSVGTIGVAALAGCPSRGSNDTPPEPDPPFSEDTTKLTAADGDSRDWFGASVAMAADGTTALVGASDDEDPNGRNAGAAYVFERAGDSWTQQLKLTPTDGDSCDAFGASVAVAGDGTTALVGALGDEDPIGEAAKAGEKAGSAYVFERPGDSWSSLTNILTGTQQAKLTPADVDEDDDLFGTAVAVGADGTTAIVGAERGEGPNGENAGSAYGFEGSGDSWTQQAKLAPTDGDSSDAFGASVTVAADGTTALVGTPDDEDLNGDQAGAAYVFQRAGDSWTQQAKLAPADRDSLDEFGSAVAMAADGITALVGAEGAENSNGVDTGAAYVFDAAGNSWRQQAKLAPANGVNLFGGSVAMAADGTTALVGAEEDWDPNGSRAGSVSVFERADDSWTQQAKLAPADGDPEDHFGSSVAVGADGTTALVGARFDEDPNGSRAGSAYVFERSGGSWPQ